MFPENNYKNASNVRTFTLAVACHLCLDPVKCLLICYSLKVDKSAPQLHCCFVGGASQLVRSAIRNTCKLFCAPPFMLLIVPYNSVHYNYIIIMQWLVVGSGVKAKGGSRRQKSALWPRDLLTITCVNFRWRYTVSV